MILKICCLYRWIILVSAGEISGFCGGAVEVGKLAMWEPDIQEKES